MESITRCDCEGHNVTPDYRAQTFARQEVASGARKSTCPWPTVQMNINYASQYHLYTFIWRDSADGRHMCSIRVVLCLTINTSRVHLTIGVVSCPNKHFLYKLHNNWRNPNNTKTWYLCASTGITTENILKWPSPPKSIRDIWPRDRKNNNLK